MPSHPEVPLDYDTVLNSVRDWPAAQRFALVQEVLFNLAPSEPKTNRRQPTLACAKGLLATRQPALSDDDVAAMLEERRNERYGL